LGWIVELDPEKLASLERVLQDFRLVFAKIHLVCDVGPREVRQILACLVLHLQAQKPFRELDREIVERLVGGVLDCQPELQRTTRW
jgi:hypothetical protein